MFLKRYPPISGQIWTTGSSRSWIARLSSAFKNSVKRVRIPKGAFQPLALSVGIKQMYLAYVSVSTRTSLFNIVEEHITD